MECVPSSAADRRGGPRRSTSPRDLNTSLGIHTPAIAGGGVALQRLEAAVAGALRDVGANGIGRRTRRHRCRALAAVRWSGPRRLASLWYLSTSLGIHTPAIAGGGVSLQRLEEAVTGALRDVGAG